MTEIEILHEDEDIIVINKPAGLLSSPGRWEPDEPTVLSTLGIEGLRLVHRLDRETSGVLLLAKNPEAQKELIRQWSDRTVEKLYLALVEASPQKDSFTISLPLVTDPGLKRVKVSKSKTAKPAITECEVVERFLGYTLLRVRPITGRRHQIRVHLSAIGLPLAVDRFYGKKQPILLSSIKPGYKKHNYEAPLISRTPLHSLRVTFRHPRSEEILTISAPLPGDFRILLKNLRKYRSFPTSGQQSSL